MMLVEDEDLSDQEIVDPVALPLQPCERTDTSDRMREFKDRWEDTR
jgi:hypothetical protein